MTYYRWNDDKNKLLRATRGVSFDQVVLHIERGNVLDIIENPNQTRFPGQQVIIVDIDGYAYAVPFVQEGQGRFLKTIVPSRKLTKRYLR